MIGKFLASLLALGAILAACSAPSTTVAPTATVVALTSPPTTIDPPPHVQWDTGPNAIVIRLTGGLSIAGAYNSNYYIPDVQLWGDGRIIWVKTEGLARRVFEGKLTAEQMKSLLQRIVDAGFFEWQDYYDALGGNSITPRLLLVNLTGRSKEISEHGAAPPAFYELQDFIKNGAGAVGREFVPTRGYLTVSPFPGATTERKWPDASIVGFTLDRVGEGRYVEGEALAFAWQAVNQNPTVPVLVESNGQFYTIMIQIPDVSANEPPPLVPPTPGPTPTSALEGYTNAWSTYTDNQYDFQFDYPTYYDVIGCGVKADPTALLTFGSWNWLTVSPSNGLMLDEYVDQEIQELDGQDGPYQPGKDDARLNREPRGIVVEALIAHHGNTFVYFERDSLIYTFHARHNTGCMAPEIGIVNPTVFYRVVESFRFTK